MADHNDHGSFLTGFTFGMLSGAVGFFLFGTKKGDQVRKNLSQEWDEARSYLEEEGVLEKGKTSLRDVFKGILDNIHHHQSSARKNPVKKKSKVVSKKSPAKTSPKKFKGTK